MSFDDNAQLDSSQVQVGGGGGGMGPGTVIGGGLGGVVLLVVALLFGIDPSVITGGGGQGGSRTNQDASSAPLQDRCRTGRDANTKVECRIVGTVNSLNAFWSKQFPQEGGRFQQPKVLIFSEAVNTGCGAASSDVGPFYCPADRTIYIDPSFYQQLQTRFGSSGGPLAQEYVVAHEYGHHISNLAGVMNRVDQRDTGANSGGVRLELQADCLAGSWAKHASSTPGPNGQPLLKPLNGADIRDALSAASAVGDDNIQRRSGSRVRPDTWTHGSSQQRQRWFSTGYQAGTFRGCDTFSAPQP